MVSLQMTGMTIFWLKCNICQDTVAFRLRTDGMENGFINPLSILSLFRKTRMFKSCRRNLIFLTHWHSSTMATPKSIGLLGVPITLGEADLVFPPELISAFLWMLDQ